MEPTAHPPDLSSRADDYRVRPLAESRSWAPVEPEAARAVDAARLPAGDVKRFGAREAARAETVEEDVEPSVPPPPIWMIFIAGAAVATLMGALLGGFMHI